MKNRIKEILIEGLITEISVKDAWTKFYSNVEKFPILKGDESLFQKLNDIYPRKGDNFNKGYFTWLYNLIRTNQLKEEDFYKAKEYLRLFDKFINRIPSESRDINRLKNLNDLYDIVKDFEGGEETIATSNKDEIRQIKQNEIDKVYEDSDWLIMIPKSERASCLIGKGTQWCTAADQSNNMFDNYNSDGPLYVLVDKYNNEKYQLHFESDQLMDAKDRPVAASYFFDNIMDDSGPFEFLKQASDKFWDFILKTSVDDIASGSYSEIFEEALISDVTPSVLKKTLETLRYGEDSRGVYLGYVFEKNPYNIDKYEIEHFIEHIDTMDEYELNAILIHLNDIKYDFDEINNEFIKKYIDDKLTLEKHGVKLGHTYQIDKGRKLRVNNVNIGVEKPYNVTIDNNSGYMDLDTLLNLLHHGQLFEKTLSIKKILRENIQLMGKIREYHDDEDYDDEEEENYDDDGESYFNAKLPKDIKRRSSKYEGRGVVWYGDPDQMIVIAADNIDGMWGNIYDDNKLQYVQDLIKRTNNYGDRVEFECSYGIGDLVSFVQIKEEQTAEKNNEFETEYDGRKRPSSTGDADLDEYVGTEDILNLPFISYKSEDEIHEFFDRNRFSLVENRNNVQNLVNEFKTLNPTQDDIESFDEFLNYENMLKEAQDNGNGDFGSFRVQLRDGHHRVMGAIAAGERYICVNLDKDGIKEFQGHYTKI